MSKKEKNENHGKLSSDLEELWKEGLSDEEYHQINICLKSIGDEEPRPWFHKELLCPNKNVTSVSSFTWMLRFASALTIFICVIILAQNYNSLDNIINEDIASAKIEEEEETLLAYIVEEEEPFDDLFDDDLLLLEDLV